MNGVYNIWKPKGITSHDAVARLRKILKMKRVGHTGTLDPMAEGVLPICVGKATRAVDMICADTKEYKCKMVLGIETTTLDSTGDVISEKEVKVTKDEIINAVNSFKGEISQIPPMYSAVHHNGQRLYELARQGITVERKPRNITIIDIETLNIDLNEVSIKVVCSKGTYIRTLCSDIGTALGCGGHMSELTRTRSGIFTAENSVTFEDVENNPENLVIPIDIIFSNYNKALLSEQDEKRVRCGVSIMFEGNLDETYRVYNEQGEFLCISKIVGEQNKKLLKMVKGFY